MKNNFDALMNNMNKSFFFIFAVASLFIISFSSCKRNATSNSGYDRIQPKGPKPAWAPTIAPQMQTVLETLDTIAPAPIYTLTPQQARQQPSFADAYMRVMRNFNIAPSAPNVDTMGRDIRLMAAVFTFAFTHQKQAGLLIL